MSTRIDRSQYTLDDALREIALAESILDGMGAEKGKTLWGRIASKKRQPKWRRDTPDTRIHCFDPDKGITSWDDVFLRSAPVIAVCQDRTICAAAFFDFGDWQSWFQANQIQIGIKEQYRGVTVEAVNFSAAQSLEVSWWIETPTETEIILSEKKNKKAGETMNDPVQQDRVTLYHVIGQRAEYHDPGVTLEDALNSTRRGEAYAELKVVSVTQVVGTGYYLIPANENDTQEVKR